MKKFFQSKGFIVSALAVLCVAILGVCWFVSRDRTDEFRPDESPPSSTSSDWSDGGVQSGDEGGGADAYAPGQSSSAEEEYPKVTSESEGEVEIDFTDTEKPEETPPPVPEGKTEIEDPGEEHEVNPDPAVPEITAPPAEESTSSNEPAPGSSNGSGAVYDPVFGWVVPGDVQQSTGDSDANAETDIPAVIAVAARQTTKTLFIFFFIFDPLHVNLCRKKRRFHFFVNRRIFSIIFPVLLPGVRGQEACGYLPHTEYRYKASQGLFRSGYKVLPSLPGVLRESDPPHT